MKHELKFHNILNELIDQARRQAASDPLITIFDLDSTIYSVAPRTQAILRQLAENFEFQRRFPEEAKILSQVEAFEKDWGIKPVLERSGIRSTLEFFEAVREHWVRDFFSSHRLHLDQPYPGAVEFVRELSDAGAEVRYLTGRDQERMGEGTYASLNQWGLPLKTPQHLTLKPKKEMNDHDFKADWLKQNVPPDRSAWFFENEPVIVNRVLRDCPNIKLIYMDTVHSGRETVPESLPRVSLSFWQKD